MHFTFSLIFWQVTLPQICTVRIIRSGWSVNFCNGCIVLHSRSKDVTLEMNHSQMRRVSISISSLLIRTGTSLVDDWLQWEWCVHAKMAYVKARDIMIMGSEGLSIYDGSTRPPVYWRSQWQWTKLLCIHIWFGAAGAEIKCSNKHKVTVGPYMPVYG